MVAQHGTEVLDLFERVFNHKAFTGRSGTFFGYEGLGSIYWHMVSKLLLAVQECCHDSHIKLGKSALTGRIIDHYYEILAGIGADKSPELYGAFPTDPYSHTPAHRGAQQPGMTGQVKEDVISRFGELGIEVKNGRLSFVPYLLNKKELLDTPQSFEYYDLNQESTRIDLAPRSLAFTLCQVPVIYQFGQDDKTVVVDEKGEHHEFEGHGLNDAFSNALFGRKGLKSVMVYFSE